MLYIGVTVLGFSESEFWEMTPRKFNALADMHVEFTNPKNRKNKKKEKQVVDSVDQIPGF